MTSKPRNSLDTDRLSALALKLNGHIPRYTSYPTAVAFSDKVGKSEWRSALEFDRSERAGKDTNGAGAQSYSIYIHIPFCSSLCYFCACTKSIPHSRTVVSPYLDALIREFECCREIIGSDISIEQIHWGGGTPNYLTPAEIKQLHETCLRCFPNLQEDADISMEIDPRTTSDEHLAMLAELGFNRLSLGIQDFDPSVQQSINRIQPFELTQSVCRSARKHGLFEINFDLIYGLPNQTQAGFQKTIEQVLSLEPNRVALYGYAHVTWLKKVQKALERSAIPTPAQRIALFVAAVSRFTAAGYQHIGLDHFAHPDDSLSKAQKNGRLNRNFMGYTTHKGARVLGFGASAISSLPSIYAQNTKDIAEYQNLLQQGSNACVRGVIRTATDQLRGDLIEAILCHGSIDMQEIERRYEIDFAKSFSKSIEELAPYIADELVSVDNNCIRLSDVGRLFARNIASVFDEYLGENTLSSTPVYSQAV